MYTYMSMNPIQLGWWKVRYEFCRVFPPFPTNLPPTAPLPSHPQDQHHTTVLEGIGDAAAVDQTTGCIVLAGSPKEGSLAATPKMWENGVCIMGISW